MTSSPSLKITLEDVRSELERRKYNKIDYYFPDKGPFARDGYSKHMEVIEATAKHRQVCMMAANRVGKSELGAYIATRHMTGIYPAWWDGKKFAKPTKGIVAGETGTLVRDSVQEKLLGPITDIGSGMIPKHLLVDKTPRAGIPDAFDTITVKHISGGLSLAKFQSYDQGREKFQATAQDWIWDDEEPPLDIYTEQLLRTMTTKGLLLSTFTPLKGISNTVLHIQAQAREGNATIITATWDDAPHLSEDDKEDLMRSLPPHQRDARSKGVPALGSGAIYPVNESQFVVDPFVIPKHWKHVYGFDVGWNNTAAAFAAIDPESGIVYIISDYKRSQAEPSIHAAAIRQRAKGDRKPGVIDPAAHGGSQKDGEQLMALYRELGLNLTPADNSVETGLYTVWEMLTTGMLKVFSTCQALLGEYRIYRRDDKGRVVKDNDHVMDALRYLCMSGIVLAKAEIPVKKSINLNDSRGTWASG